MNCTRSLTMNSGWCQNDDNQTAFSKDNYAFFQTSNMRFLWPWGLQTRCELQTSNCKCLLSEFTFYISNETKLIFAIKTLFKALIDKMLFSICAQYLYSAFPKGVANCITRNTILNECFIMPIIINGETVNWVKTLLETHCKGFLLGGATLPASQQDAREAHQHRVGCCCSRHGARPFREWYTPPRLPLGALVRALNGRLRFAYK